jgi:hypothetical protein
MAEGGLCHIYWLSRTTSCEFWSEANIDDDVRFNECEHGMR